MTKTSSPARLLEHVLVVDRLTPHRIYKPETLDTAKEPAAWDPKNPRQYVRTIGDALHLGGHAFVGVPFACSCGQALDVEPLDALRKWAAHGSEVSGLNAGVLRAHAVMRIGVSQPKGVSSPRSTVWCSCGKEFRAHEADPFDPGQALTFWLDHLMRAS